MRFAIPVVVLTLAAFSAGWFGRKLLGRRLRGWRVGLWGVVFGVLGVFLAAVGIDALGFATGYVDLGESSLRAGIVYMLIFGWNIAPIGGIAGAIAASVPRVPRRKP